MCCTSILCVTHLLLGFHQSGSVSRPDRSGAQSLAEARAAPLEAQDASQDAVAAIDSHECAQCAQCAQCATLTAASVVQRQSLIC